METCLNRLLRRCEEEICKRDYNSDHHPNNYDCPKYHETNIIMINVKKRKINDDEKNATLVRKTPPKEF